MTDKRDEIWDEDVIPFQDGPEDRAHHNYRCRSCGYSEWIPAWVVVCYGTAETVIEPNEKSYGLNQIVRHYNPGGTLYAFTEQELSSALVFKITLEEMVGKISGMTS